ncbi:omega-conotoxin-sensitive calcium channel alpha-1 subunit rbB-I [Fusarium subglutinans]|uniref:Omega-conotoxin-sensitive calcium channel alpha-1 subunit rbB-I n=1 Tax=Gibberella subglutinans TaxID=42677 RepID=A0A8H5PVZ9_GIBSU|nr:omega-conotoxin-sensitive calcium channel alpha-1 subunit rbB-I [Fusarium subglutinans]KAF5604047.1 omega-conotoxin-sensitive calcium channel alpha-1 subunit rbB-I [Fusarium subglutinans]
MSSTQEPEAPAPARNPEAQAPSDTATTNPELDLPKLQSLPAEQQDLFLLTYVSSLTKHVLDLAEDDCTAQQFYLKKEIFQIISLSSPQPSRVIRNNLGKCLAHIFGIGDRKLLFETINDLIAIISSGKSKSDAEIRTKHAAIVCLGDVFASAGDSAIGLHPLACSSLLKLLKSSSNNAGIRAACLTALGKIVSMVEGSMDEVIARDIWKQGRNHASSDKGHLVVASACRALKTLFRHTPYFLYSSDLDKLETAISKAFDSPSVQVRLAAAECFAEALFQGHSEGGPPEVASPKGKKSKKALKRQSTIPKIADDELDIPSRSASPAPSGKRSQVLALSLTDILKNLASQYIKSTASNRIRTAIGVCYGKLFRRLGEKLVETNYLKIVESLAIDVLGHSTIANNRYRLLISRNIVDVVIQDVIGRKILGESGQISAAKSLINNIFKNYPQALAERPEPSKHTLIATLSAVSSLIQSLGSAANTFAESCRDGLLQVLQHSSYTVQVFASHCMKTLVLACPQQLLPCLSVCMNSLNRELSLLGSGRNSPRRCIGFAHGLAATLSASPARPLYGSVEINSRVLTIATNMLKSSSQAQLRVASTQIQVAWVLIGGLMSLGPNFVKIHLSQLLLLWKNALPKPLAKDNTSARSFLEVSFLTHVRECAMGSILAFLEFNSRLLTVDVSKRIATMLQNTTAFLRTLPFKKISDDVSQRLAPALQLQDLEMMVQRRVLQCYVRLVNLSPAGGSEALLQSNLLTLAISLFADPENYAPNSLSASIANAAATFESVWDVGDNSGFGITGLVAGPRVRKLPGQQENSDDGNTDELDSPEDMINNLLRSPICGSLEHDASVLYIGSTDSFFSSPDPPATEVINAAIQLFAFAFPLTPGKVQESILEQIRTFASAGTLIRDPGRKAAINVNLAAAILATMRVAVKETKSPSGDISNQAVEALLQDIVRDFVLDPDEHVRSLGYAATARLCNVYGNGFTNNEIKYLVDTIVGNREPSARAGCAMALGSIQTQVGGMAAGYHLKTILGILMSLCNDPHPVVHFWALEALSLAADASGLSFAGYVPSTLGMLVQLYVSETHHAEISSAITMNLELELSTTSAIARCVDSLINVLGPDLQDATKSRELIFTLVNRFREEDDWLVQRAALGCLEHVSLYAPGHMQFADYVKLLQKYLMFESTTLRDVSVDGIHNMMKRNPQDVLKEADAGFEEQLWLVLDTVPSHDGIRNIIRNWMHHTCLTETNAWLQRFQAVLKMTRARPKAEDTQSGSKGSGVPDLQDEEVAGFAAAAGAAKDEKETKATSEVEPLRWQVTTFALSCIDEMFLMIAKDVTTNGESKAQSDLQGKVADVVRMAFSASTSGVLELRIWGLKIIGDILKMFGKTPDPDFEEAMLLEQYQAQISSALTPAFAADSSPELASEAVNVCASFISIGIVTDVDRMGRILKTLVSALENFSKDSENAAIGDLKSLSSNAQVMVKISVFSAWAELQVASSGQKYLLDVLRPHIGTLTPLWLESLREFARLRFEPDISMTLGPPSLSGSLDTIYAALNRETLLRFYQDAWLKLVDAIASLIEQDSEFVFDALDGKESDGPSASGQSKNSDINYRDEPVAFFFVLFGLAFEALATRSGQSDSLATHEQTLAILQALKKILHPSVSGHAIYRPDVFSETMDLLDRLVLTESLDVQGVIVEIASVLCIAHPSARRHATEEGDLSDDIDQLFELTRIIVLVLTGLLPNLSEGNQPARHQMNEEAILLIRSSLNALVDAAEVFPAIIKTDLHACIIHIFATILSTPGCQELIVPQSLSTLKRFVGSMSKSRRNHSNGEPSSTDVQLQGCLRRFLSIYLNAQKREAPQSLTCVKNCLLATTILFTGGQNHLPASEALVARYLEELMDCLTDRMTAKIAANCIKSLLLQPSQTSADLSIARYLFPRLVAFVTDTDPEDPENARSLIAHTLCQYVGTGVRGRHLAAMAVVIPTLMARATAEGEEVYQETSARLLELAAIDQETFRAVVGGISDGQKGFLEEVIRFGRQTTDQVSKAATAESGQPSIALKMDFGG